MSDSKPYELSLPQLAQEYKTDLSNGLTTKEAAVRLSHYGPNKLPEEKQVSFILVFFKQFKNPLVCVFFIAAIVIFFSGHERDAYIISGMLIFNALVSALYEWRARTIFSKLPRFFNTRVTAIRNGEHIILNDYELTPGDLIVLTHGEKVSADARIIEAHNIQVDESMLTENSTSIEKSASALPLETTIYDQTNMVFKGSYIVTGKGKALVVATGAETQIGKIKKSIEIIDKEIPLKKELVSLTRWVLFFVIILCVTMLFIGLAEGKSFNELFAILTALCVCVVPAGLPAILTLILATGAYRMAKKNVLIKKMHAIEMLGRTTIVAIDKTEILTQNSPAVRGIIEQSRKAGLSVIMITGDYKETALHAAEAAGIFREGDSVLDGVELSQMSQEELVRRIEKTTVYSHISPDVKITLIKLYKKLGKAVAMTGGFITDAPSLVAADVGIAMGNTGTDIARQAASVVILDDSFSSIVTALEQSRHLFYTIRRVILYFFATAIGEILVVLLALIMDLPVPILPIHILWLNVVTNGFLDGALSTEPLEKNILYTPVAKHLVDKKLMLKILSMALAMGIVSFFVFYLTYQHNVRHARTLTLVTIVMFQWFNVWNCRSETKSVFQLGLFSNTWLLAALAVVLLLQTAIIYVPFLQNIFQTSPLTVHQWCIILCFASSIFFIEELRKLFIRIKNMHA